MICRGGFGTDHYDSQKILSNTWNLNWIKILWNKLPQIKSILSNEGIYPFEKYSAAGFCRWRGQAVNWFSADFKIGPSIVRRLSGPILYGEKWFLFGDEFGWIWTGSQEGQWLPQAEVKVTYCRTRTPQLSHFFNSNFFYKYRSTYTNTQIQIHQIQILKYKYTDTNVQIHILLRSDTTHLPL